MHASATNRNGFGLGPAPRGQHLPSTQYLRVPAIFRRVFGPAMYGRGQIRLSPTGVSILHRRSESLTPHQQHGKKTAGENVEGHAEAGPPCRDAWILNKQVVKDVEDSVSRESGRG